MVSTLGGCVCRNSGHRAEPSERGGSRNQHVVLVTPQFRILTTSYALHRGVSRLCLPFHPQVIIIISLLLSFLKTL